jgi:hypothetical protein
MMLAPIADRFFTKSLDLRQPYPKRPFVAVIRRLNYQDSCLFEIVFYSWPWHTSLLFGMLSRSCPYNHGRE